MMTVGLLWFDNDSGRDLAAKVARAAAHYQVRFGRPPQICYVNPATLGRDRGNGRADANLVGGVRVVSSKTVLPNHFWIGVAEEPAEGTAVSGLNGKQRKVH
jgi:hypothetical protein